MRTRRLAVSLCALAFLSACGGEGPADDGRVDVVASFYPLAYAASGVGGDRVRVTNLTPVGVEPHDVELTADQVDAIEDADLVLYVGGRFQPAVAKVARKARRAVDFAPDGDDPHFWLDPVQMAAAVDRIGALLRVDARGLKNDVASLDLAYRTSLKDCDRRDIVTNHDAFGHLARRYGLNQFAIAGTSPEGEPDAARLAELADVIARKGVTTVFAEDLSPPDVAETLAREAGAKTATLSTLEGLTKAQQREGKTYRTVMYDNLRTLTKALGCRPAR
jgi:zinc transport system substrate-binding protein